jgi:hypothetical protein
MQFFLYEILARIVAIYFCYHGSRELWNGLVQRKIVYCNSDWLDLLLDWRSDRTLHRDTAPVRYWITIVLHITALVGCFFVAIFGWWKPNT